MIYSDTCGSSNDSTPRQDKITNSRDKIKAFGKAVGLLSQPLGPVALLTAATRLGINPDELKKRIAEAREGRKDAKR